MWDKIEHEGFEIRVLPILAYGTSAPITLWHYSAYVCRHGAYPHLAEQSTRFYELIKTFGSEDEARDAGYRAGRRLVDSLPGEFHIHVPSLIAEKSRIARSSFAAACGDTSKNPSAHLHSTNGSDPTSTDR
jgi:hypothetical protein